MVLRLQNLSSFIILTFFLFFSTLGGGCSFFQSQESEEKAPAKALERSVGSQEEPDDLADLKGEIEGEDKLEQQANQVDQVKVDEIPYEAKKAIEDILIKNSSRFQDCYVKVIRNGHGKSKGGKSARPLPEGNITLAFSLSPQGKILRAGLEENDLPMGLKACLVQVLWKIKFPQSSMHFKRETDFRLPLNFSLEN